MKGEFMESKRNLFFTVIILLIICGCNQNSWENNDNSSDAYRIMKNYVKEKLKSPSTAKFPKISEISIEKTVTEIDDPYELIYILNEINDYNTSFNFDDFENINIYHAYIVKGYVDSQNGYGALIRTKYIGSVLQYGKNSWSLIQIIFQNENNKYIYDW